MKTSFLKTLRIAPLLCAAVLLPAIAAERPEPAMVAPLRLLVEGGGVAVHDANGRFMQILPVNGEDPAAENAPFFTFTGDMNFDGYPDVGVLNVRGMYNDFYDCWLWNPAAGVFEMRGEMSDLPNPKIVPDEKKIVSCLHGCAASHLLSEHAWEDGEFVTVSRVEQGYPEEGHGVLVRRFVRGEDGEMRLEWERPLDDGVAAGGGGGQVAGEGLNLFPVAFHGERQLVAGATFPDGSWRLEHEFPDASVFLTSWRMPATETGEAAVKAFIASEWPDARDVRVAPFAKLSESLSLPAFRADFLWGENEDTIDYTTAAVFAGKWSFFFVLGASAAAVPFADDVGGAVAATDLAAILDAELEDMLLSISETTPDNWDLFGVDSTPVHPVAPTCGDDSLRVLFTNLTRATIHRAAIMWKVPDGGARFAWASEEVAPEQFCRFAAEEAAELAEVYFDLESMGFHFADLSKLRRRQQMALDVVLDADGRPHLDLRENRDVQRLSPEDYFHEWISVTGKLHRYD